MTLNSPAKMDASYSVENAQKFHWSSVSGYLNPERRSHLETYLLGHKILDAGCGGGAYVHFLTQKGFDATGVDLHDQFLEVARANKLSGTYIQGSVTDLPFADKTFDCTYCYDVLEHVDDEAAILELARVTNKRLILAVPKEDEIMYRFLLTFFHYQDKTHLRNYTEDSLRSLVSHAEPRDIKILPELAVPILSLVQATSRYSQKFTYPLPGIDNPSGLRLREKLKTQIINFKPIREITKKVFKKLLFYACFEEIYTGLVAIVDLP